MADGPAGKFEPVTVKMFMGGTFHLGHPPTVAELRRAIQAMDQELAGWGDTTEIAEVWADDGAIRVTLKHGIHQ